MIGCDSGSDVVMVGGYGGGGGGCVWIWWLQWWVGVCGYGGGSGYINFEQNIIFLPST